MIRVSSIANHAAIILLVFLSQQVAGQQGTPWGLNYEIYKTIPVRNIQSVDPSLFDKLRRRTSGKIPSETVAYNFRTHFSPHTEGNWKKISTGIDSWFLKIRSRDAFGLALVFSGVRLLPGEKLFVYNQQGLRGPYTADNVPPSGILPLDFLRGDEITIEYHVPTGSRGHGTFVVETVSHAWQNIFSYKERASAAPATRFGSDCYFCLDDNAIEKERRAVVMIVVHSENSTKICTGTLVNNTANDHTPYVLTAEHCVSNEAEANRSVFTFGFEDEACVEQPYYDHILHGAQHRASLFENDFAILELYDKPPLEFHPYYAGWDISDQYRNGVTCIHHPHGGPRKISVSNGAIRTGNLTDGPSRTPNAFWNVIRWDVGATEAGSSGAALLNKNSHVIGTLSGGSSQCSTPYNDYFAKLSSGWEASPDPDRQLKYWLDPVGSGVQRLDGIDPFEGIQADCYSMSNVQQGEQQVLLPYTNGEGYFSGYNSDGIASFAEKFTVTDSMMLTGVTLNVGSVNRESGGGLLVRVQSSADGLPGVIISESFVPYYRLTEDTLNYVGIYPYANVAGDFFISYTLSYSPGDSFALKQSAWRGSSSNTAFAKPSSGWVPMTAISPGAAGSSLGIRISVCEDILIDPPPRDTSISFYPNPATIVLVGKLPGSLQENWRLQVFDLQGKQHDVLYNIYDNTVVVTTADLRPGMYIVRLSTVDTFYQSKFVKH